MERLSTHTTPENTRIYAIGDIHGRLDLLKDLHILIREDAAQHTEKHIEIIYLGDYIDRGPHSAEVIDALIRKPINGANHTYIKGNHEMAMLDFLMQHADGRAWLSWGGKATLRSYGVQARDAEGNAYPTELLRQQLTATLPAEHLLFLKQLKPYYVLGDYIFVHAGLRPGVPLEDQHPLDLYMIRDKFIDHPNTVDKTIVFGHTVFEDPFTDVGKIGVDTGAYATEKLTAVVLDGESQHFLHTKH